jgi:hypothetical protein
MTRLTLVTREVTEPSKLLRLLAPSIGSAVVGLRAV